MSWLKIDDGFGEHPKIVGLSNQAFRVHVVALCLCARLLTDGRISEQHLRKIAADLTFNPRRYVDELVAARLWTQKQGGWSVNDYLDYNPSSTQIKERRELNARRQALFRNEGLRDSVRRRDRDICQYCGVRVKWSDRRGPTGGTYDHVDPYGPNSTANLVVACRGCNSSKGNRTPEEAGFNRPVTSSDLATDQIRVRPPTRPDSINRTTEDLSSKDDAPAHANGQVIDLIQRVAESFGSAS